MSSIKLRKLGKFYSAFDDDAKILHYLFNYKISSGRVGFPQDSYNKVINILEEKNINYEIIDNEDKIKKNFKDKNKYNIYLTKSLKKEIIENKVSKIEDRINSINDDKIIEILDSISELISNE